MNDLIARLAEKQHGALSREQAVEAGFTDEAIRHRLTAARWRGRHPGVYVVAGTPRTREERLMCGCVPASPEAVVSHRAAAPLSRPHAPRPRRRRVAADPPPRRRRRLGQADLDDLVAVLDELGRRGRRGVGRLRASLADREGVPDSVLDAALERLLRKGNVEGLVSQWDVYDRARFVARVDAAIPELGIVIGARSAPEPGP